MNVRSGLRLVCLAHVTAIVFAWSVATPATVYSQEVAAGDLQCIQTPSHLSIREGDLEILRYNIVAPKAPEGVDSIYERSGYIHPIRTPAGNIVTGDFAADHPHQHGLFAAWTNTSYGGRPIDFWNQHKGTGIVLHDRVVAVSHEDGSAGFTVGLKHCALDDDGSKTKILDDVWTVTVSRVIEKKSRVAYRVTFDVAQTNVTRHPLTINEYHYGGIGFRGNNDWFSNESSKTLAVFVKKPNAKAPPIDQVRHRFLTSEGNDRREGNHSRPEWTMLYGIVAGEAIAGVKLSGNPSNDRYPHPVRLHPTKPYFSVTPCFLGEFDIRPGDTFHANYKIDVFDGEP